MTDHILTFTLFWQVLNIVVLEIMDAKLITVDWEVDLTVIVMAIFQVKKKFFLPLFHFYSFLPVFFSSFFTTITIFRVSN